jgi:hypothetical protein
VRTTSRHEIDFGSIAIADMVYPLHVKRSALYLVHGQPSNAVYSESVFGGATMAEVLTTYV